MTENLFHIATALEWDVARAHGHYRPASLDTEGFIHCSAHHQVAGVVERYYRDRADLVVLEIDPSRCLHPLVWEDTTGRGEPFPHLYGPLPVEAVRTATPITVNAAGTIFGWRELPPG